ncbi:MFS transporter [Nocardioides sp. YJ-D4]
MSYTPPADRLHKSHVVALLLCCLVMAIDGYDVVAYGTVLGSLMGDWGISPVTAGYLGSIALVGLLIGGLFVSPMADRTGRKPLLIGALGTASVASFTCAFAESVVVLGTLRFVVGVALGALVPNMLALVGEFSPAKYRAMFVSSVSAFYCIGGVSAALVAINVVPTLSWRAVFALGLAPAFLVPALLKWLPESPVHLSRRAGVAHDNHVGLQPLKSRVRGILADGNATRTALIWVFFAMCMLLTFGLNTWLPKLMQTAGYPLSSALTTLVVLNAGGFVGGIGGGWIAGKVGYRSTLLGLFGIAVAALTVLSFEPATALINVCLFCAGGASIGTLAIVHAFAVEYYPTRVRSAGVGFASGIGRVGAIAGPALGGLLLARELSFQQNFLFVALPAVVGGIAVAIVTRGSFNDSRPEHTDTWTDVENQRI